MKTITENIIAALSLVMLMIGASSCTEKAAIGQNDVPIVSADDFRIYADEENTSLTHFEFLREGVTPFWEIVLEEGKTYEGSERSFTLSLPDGTYHGTLYEYGHNGKSEPFPFTFKVSTDFIPLLCGEDDSKVWVWDRFGALTAGGNDDSGGQRIFGYVWDEPWEKNSWWYSARDLESMGVMDDEMSFRKDGKFILDAKGSVWRDYKDQDAGIVAEKIEWTPAGTETWEISKKDGKNQITFAGGGFPSIIATKESGINGTFELAEISKNVLKLRLIVNEAEFTEFNFIRKGYEPEEKPEPPTPPTPPEPPVVPEYTVVPLAPEAPEMALITAKEWKPGEKFGYKYGTDDLYDIRKEAEDDRLTFLANGKMTISAGADGKIMNDDVKGGIMEFTPSENAGWILGHIAEMGPDRLFIQFKDGGYPCIMPKNPGTDFLWEVVELTETSLRLHYELEPGGYFVVILEASL